MLPLQFYSLDIANKLTCEAIGNIPASLNIKEYGPEPFGFSSQVRDNVFRAIKGEIATQYSMDNKSLKGFRPEVIKEMNSFMNATARKVASKKQSKFRDIRSAIYGGVKAKRSVI